MSADFEKQSNGNQTVRGGRRPNAGRKPGSPNKATQRRQEEIAASGVTPLEFMLQRMRDPSVDAAQQFEAAKAAAPYVHPRLAAVEHSGDMTVRHEEILGELE